VERPGQGIEGFNLVVRRADKVIVVSLLIMAPLDDDPGAERAPDEHSKR